jgi:hypothetical protein
MVAGRKADPLPLKSVGISGWPVLEPALLEQTVASLTVFFGDFPARIVFAE